MSEHDVPAGRDELRERLATTLAALVALRDVVRDSGELNGMEYDALGVQVNRAIEKAEAALLARQEAPAEGLPLSAQLSQAAAWMRVWDECQRLGMDTSGAPSTRTGLDIVLDFIRGRAAPQEAREPEALRQTVAEAVEKLADRLCPAWRVGGYADGEYLAVVSTIDGLAGKLAAARPAPEAREPELLGYVVERQLTTGEWVRVWRGSTMWVDRDEAVLDRDAYALDGIPAHIRPVYLGAPAPAEATEPSAPEGATWGDVRSGLRAELIAEGMPITEATRIARKVVHRFSAAEATERSES